MFPLRCIRRRSIDILLKGVILTTVCLFIVHMTSSHPKGGVSQRTLDSIPVQKPLTIQKREDVAQKSERRTPFIVRKPTENPKPKSSREDKFYKNIVVHFDLKGAPPKVDYFEQLLRLAAKGGATGILLEWEDMFPWKGELEKFKSTEAYSEEDVGRILRTAKSLQLDIIPLVQTFGHLEWILKYEETRKYRENDAYPQVLCLGNEDGVKLVKEALRQVIQVHSEYGLSYMHIGADEAFEFGVCQESINWISKYGGDGGKQLLALAHLKNIAEFVKTTVGKDITVLAWHDMLKDFDSRLIKKLELGSIIEPVVWDYSENHVTLNDYIFSSLAENFPTMWGSSAFKGANYPSASKSDIRHYEANNLRWISATKEQSRKFQNGFHGLIITGWQRYDHLAGLCETLPIGTASMMLQLQIAVNAPRTDSNYARTQAGKLLKCNGFNVDGTNVISNQCDYKGFNAYLIYQSEVANVFRHIEDELSKNHHLMGWANRYNRKFNISQNWYHKEMIPVVQGLLNQYVQVENNLRDAMKDLFFPNTIDEFIFENLGEMSDKLHQLLADIQRLDKIRVWPKREFSIKGNAL